MTRHPDEPTPTPDARLHNPPRHAHRDPTVDYTTEHTAADPAHVHREEDVANDDKAMPSENHMANILAFAGAGVALLAVVLDYLEIDVVAVILAIIGLLMAIVGLVMAWNDARGSVVAPLLCTFATAVVLLVALLDVLDVEERVPQGAEAVEPLTTVEPEEIPADPAEIDADVASDAVEVEE